MGPVLERVFQSSRGGLEMGKRSTFLWNHDPSSPRTEREKDGEEKTEGGMVSVFLSLLAIHFPPPGIKLPPLEAHRNKKKVCD